MKYLFTNKISPILFSLSGLILLSLVTNVSSAFAWAAGRGCIYYNGQPLNGVQIKDLTSGITTTSGSDGDGCYSFDRIDCGASQQDKAIQILGFLGGIPPSGIPAGGSFNPSSFSLGQFGNGQVLSFYSVNYIPPPAAPTPTLVPCGGPCTANSQCSLACPICANGTCAAPTPTPADCGGPCTASSQCNLNCPICANGICAAPTPTPAACGGPCTTSSQCDLSCPVCTNNKCVAACGGPCTTSNQCDLSCSICANSVCVAPTPTLVPCGGPCTANSQCSLACPICAGGSCLAPSATPTPTPDCKCDGLSLQGVFFSGTKVDVQGFAKVKNPESNRAEVLSMVYDLYKDDVKVASSGEVKVAGAPQRITNNEGVADRYNSLWAFSIPGTGLYRLSETINCGWKSDNVQGIQTSSNAIVTNTPEATKKPTTEMSPLSFFFNWITGIFNPSKNIYPQALTPTPTPTPTPFIPATSKSIKIQTVSPELDIKCTEATFKVEL